AGEARASRLRRFGEPGGGDVRPFGEHVYPLGEPFADGDLVFGHEAAGVEGAGGGRMGAVLWLLRRDRFRSDGSDCGVGRHAVPFAVFGAGAAGGPFADGALLDPASAAP